MHVCVCHYLCMFLEVLFSLKVIIIHICTTYTASAELIYFVVVNNYIHTGTYNLALQCESKKVVPP